uniref:Uncharacterized protein n=1 Tax=Tanacetum cinerariifolium TaxID=118510 RepID=A0A6L2K3H3_TANCI|nr:hypothetical protein [Tanacetum cinerariifolium]
MENTLSKFMSESAKRHKENSNLIKEIQASMDAAIQNQGESIKTLEIQISKMRKVLLERGFGSLSSSTEANPRDQVKSISTTTEVDPYLIRQIGSSQYAISTGQNRAGVSVMPLSTYLNLGLGKLTHTKLTVELADKTVKYPKGFAEYVLVGIDYIELNDLNEPFKLRRDQVDELMPTIKEGKVVEKFRARNDARMDSNVFFGYLSDCNHDKKININCVYNLKFSCMIGFEFTHANFFPILYVNVMSKKFHNTIMKDKMEYKGNSVVEALMNIPIFVGNFSILTDIAILDDMDGYRDEGMGDAIFGEPFLREVGINAKCFEGIITIYNDNESVKEYSKNDKIGSKPDKNRKRGEAGKSQKQLQ